MSCSQARVRFKSINSKLGTVQDCHISVVDGESVIQTRDNMSKTTIQIDRATPFFTLHLYNKWNIIERCRFQTLCRVLAILIHKPINMSALFECLQLP